MMEATGVRGFIINVLSLRSLPGPNCNTGANLELISGV